MNRRLNNLLENISPARFAAKQGQYLAFIWAYAQITRRAPAEADSERYFEVSAPSVHQMLKTLAKLGLIAKQPGVARSTQLLVPPHELPILGVDRPIQIAVMGR